MKKRKTKKKKKGKNKNCGKAIIMINYFLNKALKRTIGIEVITYVDDYLQDPVSRRGKGCIVFSSVKTIYEQNAL